MRSPLFRFPVFSPRVAQSLRDAGRIFFGLSTIAFGAAQMMRADFVRLVPSLPSWVPGRTTWAVVAGALLIVIGAAILSRKQLRLAAAMLAGLIAVSLILLHLPEIASGPMRGFKWTNPCKALALLGGAILLGGSRKPLLLWGPPLFFGGFLIVCGIHHFVYADFVMQLVPGWLPGRFVWTYFTGAALVAGGIGVLVPPVARWAATLAGVMIFLWVFILHLPRAFNDLSVPGELDGVFEALALAGVAFLLAGQPSARAENEPESGPTGPEKLRTG